jgi:hypothetical protein
VREVIRVCTYLFFCAGRAILSPGG